MLPSVPDMIDDPLYKSSIFLTKKSGRAKLFYEVEILVRGSFGGA